MASFVFLFSGLVAAAAAAFFQASTYCQIWSGDRITQDLLPYCIPAAERRTNENANNRLVRELFSSRLLLQPRHTESRLLDDDGKSRELTPRPKRSFLAHCSGDQLMLQQQLKFPDKPQTLGRITFPLTSKLSFCLTASGPPFSAEHTS